LEKRTVLALVLIALVYWFSTQYLWKPVPIVQNEEAVASVPSDSLVVPDQINVGETDKFVPYDRQVSPYETNIAVDNAIVLENDKIRLTFSNKGAVINQIEIKDFFLSDKVTPVALIPESQAIMQVYNSVIPDLNEAVFQHDIITSREGQTIIFSIDTGVSLQKRYTLSGNYHVKFELIGENLPAFDEYSIAVNSGIGITEDNKAAVKDIKNSFKFSPFPCA
jgi:YidC/Oxa1 family membrane protein insertase